ncbi:MAG: hypothetical protein LUH22_01630 [Bacteroides sp.]|nr:hypothetical protein [Bacteroides sp.]
MKLPIYKATSFNYIIPKGGHSKLWIVSVNAKGKLKPFVVKLYQTTDIEDNNKMTAEVLGCLLAKEFNLTTSTPAIIEFTSEFRESLNVECSRILNSLDERSKFGTEYYPGTFLFAPQTNLEDAERILPIDTLYAFDYFICNKDRNSNKPNLLIKNQSAVLIDHEYALDINERTISRFKYDVWNQRFRHHLFYNLLKKADPAKKNNYFKDFEYHLEKLQINNYNSLFTQLKDLGFTNNKERLVKRYFWTVLSNPKKFTDILRASIQ